MALATSTLLDIQNKVRLLTRSPGPNDLTDDQLNQYINTFVAYDFPEHLRLFNLRQTFTFYTTPNVDVYATDTTDVNDQFFDFNNKYINVFQPVYIAGYNSLFLQNRSQLYGMYPIINALQLIGTGDGVTTAFSGTLPNVPMLQNNVTFSSTDINGNKILVTDFPSTPALGSLDIPNGPSVGTIQYQTGAYTFDFGVAPASGVDINAQYVPYVASRPRVLCFFDNEFIVRPVPDRVYSIQFEVNVAPTQLLATSENPQLNEWWQYIAYGAAKKVFEDRLDMDSVQLITPEFEKQQSLILARTVTQNSTQRTQTIYSENMANGYWWGFGQWYNGQY